MLPQNLHDVAEIWCLDTEFRQPPGERVQAVHCLVAKEYYSGRTYRLWADDLRRLPTAPFPCDHSALSVAYFASAEMHCFLTLGWPLPVFLLDLFTEFRVATNGISRSQNAEEAALGNKLLGALHYYGLPHMEAGEKQSMQKLALRGGPFTGDEREALLQYCEQDVDALLALLSRMAPTLDLARALVRGRAMTVSARVEHAGVPLDVAQLTTVRHWWPTIQDELITRLDTAHIYEGRSFRADRWGTWVASQGIAWPLLDSGELDLKQETFRALAKVHPTVATYQELRYSLSQLRLEKLAVGHDGRNRLLLSPFNAITSRYSPSTTGFIFGPATWVRSLIQPPPGYGFAYIDWEQQEFGIAAALSQDANMLTAYASGDPYLAFAKLAGAVPADATKATHKLERERFKTCVLGVQYAMGERSLADRIGQPPIYARELLAMHRRTFPVFWWWSDRVVDYAFQRNSLYTALGWKLRIEGETNPRTVRNFPMQANGAEMLRLALGYALDAGIEVVAPVHDAIGIVAPLATIEEAVATTQGAMERASAELLGGFRLRTEAAIVRHPDHYRDPRGVVMHRTIWEIIARRQRETA